MIKKSLLIICLPLFVYSIVGCTSLKRIGLGDRRPVEKEMPVYSGPKAKVALTDIEIKSPKATNEVGVGLREMLLNALKSSNRFLIIEPQANAPTPASGQDLIITAILTEFEPQISGGSAGMGGGGGAASGILGGLLGTSLTKAHMSLEVRIVDTATSEVLSSTLIKAQASEGSENTKSPPLGNWSLGTGLAAYANTPMEKAIRICVIEAARYISQTIPANYYKY